MWSLMKRRVAANNVGQETKNIVKLTEEAFASITAEDWQKQCQHVKNIEDKFYNLHPCMDREIDQFIIELGNESDTESDSTESSDSDLSGVIPFDHTYCKS
ncbi:unnamed protein product, partial [Brenthis ino]